MLLFFVVDVVFVIVVVAVPVAGGALFVAFPPDAVVDVVSLAGATIGVL